MTGIALDVAQVFRCLVFFRYLGSIDPGGWMASSMASSTTALVFLGGLGLRLISGGGRAVGLSLVFVLGGLALGLPVGVLLIFFGRRAVALWAPGIDVPNVEGRLQVSLCLYITCLLHNFRPTISVSSLMIQLGSNRRTESLSEIAYESGLVGGIGGVELFQHSL